MAGLYNFSEGERPARSVIDFVNDGAAEVTELIEKLRVEFADRLEYEVVLLPAKLRSVRFFRRFVMRNFCYPLYWEVLYP
nr:hypothetical protein [Sporomusa silvacetica]